MLKRLFLILSLSLSLSLTVFASDNDVGMKMRVTCYTSKSTAYTYSGQQVHEGGCASSKANIGKTAYLYTLDTHELVAKLEINDTGSNSLLRSGKAIDVWMPTLSDCYDWIDMYGDYLYVVIKEEKENNNGEQQGINY